MPSRRPTTRRRRLLSWAARRAAQLLEVSAGLVVAGVLVSAAAGLLLPLVGGRVVIVAGPSMEPAIAVGSLALIGPIDAGGPRPGEVVTFTTGNGQVVTHRVTRVAYLESVQYVETKGDANATADPVLTESASIIGRVVMVVPVAGYLESVLARPAGLATMLALLASAWLGAGVLREIAVAELPHVVTEPLPEPLP